MNVTRGLVNAVACVALFAMPVCAEDKIEVASSVGAGLEVLEGFSASPDSDGVLGVFELSLPEYVNGLLFTGSRFYKAGNRYFPVPFTPETAGVFKPDNDGVFLLLELKGGNYLAVVPCANELAHTVIEGEGGVFKLRLANLGSARLEGDVPLFAWGVDANAYAASYKAWAKAFEGNDYGRMRGQKEYHDIFKHLGWCSWESYHKNISEETILDTIRGIKTSGMPVKWVLLDDGHSARTGGVSPNEKFPNAYTKIRGAIDGDPVQWMGLWYSSLGVQRDGVKYPADFGEFSDYMIPQAGEGWGAVPKPTEEAMGKWWEYMFARGAEESDFLKVDFIKDIHNLYAGVVNGKPISDTYQYPSVTQLCVWYRKAMEEAIEERGLGLMNCNGNNWPNLFFARYSSVTRCSEDYKKNNLKSAINHIYHSYHDVLWQGQVYWGDHDMFHSNDEFAGEIMAVTKAMSGAPVYLSDKPEDFEPTNILPLCYEDGRLPRPLAPAVVSSDSLFFEPGVGGLYKAFAPLNDGSVAIHVMNLSDGEQRIRGNVKRSDYIQAGGMIQPWAGRWKMPEEGLVVYDVLAGTGSKFGGKHKVELNKPLAHRLLQLSPIRDGWAFIGRTDKYLCAATGRVLSSTESEFRIELEETGPFAIYSAKGVPQAKGIVFHAIGDGLYKAEIPIGDLKRKIVITRSGQTGPWGDQGDGTYRNPILNADYPDVDIEQVGDTYYMMTSTNHYAPGMLLLESKDLVNWEIIGHVWDKLTWAPDYNWDKMTGYKHGVWAGDLAYHDGKWYSYVIDWANGLYVSTADDIRGPWSPPHKMFESLHWDDPAVFWDEDEKQAYLVCNTNKDPNIADGQENVNRVFKMSWDGLSVLDEGKAIYHGPGAEAAKIYKINGLFYIFMAEWRDGDRKQIALRGKSMYGPFERKVLMEKGNGVERSCCQGALVQAADGSWWYTHQLVQARAIKKDGTLGGSTEESYEGRSQWLIPVKWEDGWPVLGEDPDGNGIGNTVHHYRKPIDGFPITAPQTDDEFGSRELGPQWEWNHNPRDDHWSLTEREGWLRLKAGVPVGEGGFWNAANTVSQRIMGKGKGVVTVKVDISGMKPGQQAGFCHHSGQYVLLGIRVWGDGSKRLIFNNDGKETLGPVITKNEIYYRTNIDGIQADFSYSLDGKSWIPFGDRFMLEFGRWRGDRLGFYCWNDGTDSGHIDVDWFHYEYDGPKGAK